MPTDEEKLEALIAQKSEPTPDQLAQHAFAWLKRLGKPKNMFNCLVAMQTIEQLWQETRAGKAPARRLK